MAARTRVATAHHVAMEDTDQNLTDLPHMEAGRVMVTEMVATATEAAAAVPTAVTVTVAAVVPMEEVIVMVAAHTVGAGMVAETAMAVTATVVIVMAATVATMRLLTSRKEPN